MRARFCRAASDAPRSIGDASSVCIISELPVIGRELRQRYFDLPRPGVLAGSNLVLTDNRVLSYS
jgi:hypothetical protein